MAKISDFLENELLDHSLAVGAYTMPTNVYLAAYIDDPTDADAGTEGSAAGYGRPEITFNAASGGSTSNNGALNFGTASADWGTLTHVGIRDDQYAGSLLWHGALAAQRIVQNGDSFTIPNGSLQVSLA